MAHYVKCKYCGETFNRDAKEFVQIKNRYAHAECALRLAQENNQEPPEVIDPLDIVTCCYCKQPFNKKLTSGYGKRGKKYFHPECFIKESQREHTDKEKLEMFIMDLYKTEYVSPRIQKQIKEYVEEYGYTYSGIQYTLEYWINIKKRPYSTKYDTIGIVPHIYEQAKSYKYAIYLATIKNIDKDIAYYKPKDISVTIPPPKTASMKPKLFSFLDEEEECT